MIDIDKKIEKIEKNCLETARKELSFLKTENDKISEGMILEKVNNYKDELSKKYEVELNKLQREFNKNTFEYEMQEKKRVNDYRQSLIDNLEVKIISEFQNFANSSEYKYYLLRNIEKLIAKFHGNKCTVFITENDYAKFGQEILMAFNVNVSKIDNENIGGCIVIDSNSKISIDNTLRTNILEKVKQINI